MSEANTVSVSILGREYLVACPKEEEARLLAAGAYLDEQMTSIREQGKVVGLERIAVMAALNVCHELMQSSAEARLQEQQETASRALDGLIDKVDDALDSLRSPPG